MKFMGRREFLAGAMAGGLGLVLPQQRGWGQVLGANAAIRGAGAGVRGKGNQHMERFARLAGVRVTALCDPDEAVLAERAKAFQDQFGVVQTYRDIRQVMDSKDIDAVVIAAPDHWHALMTVWACQAGKDVYVEKPVSYDIWEGKQMVAAARKYNRIVQAGTQSRSDRGLKALVPYLRSGQLGSIQMAHVIVHIRRESVGKVAETQAVPASVDYDLWCGPSEKLPVKRKQFHYDWHWQWPWGTGECGNNGVHNIDVARWILGNDRMADGVISVGGRFGYEDDGETPNTHIAFLDYKPVPMIVEIQGLPHKLGSSAMSAFRGLRDGVLIDCEGGYFSGDKSGGWIYDKRGKKMKQIVGDGGADHHTNFIEAVQNRKTESLNADIQEGHLSTSLCHMANVSHRLGRPSGIQEIGSSLSFSGKMQEMWDRFQSHLKANGVDLNRTPPTLGAKLSVDTEHQTFTGLLAEEANRLSRRMYRRPFMIPETV